MLCNERYRIQEASSPPLKSSYIYPSFTNNVILNLRPDFHTTEYVIQTISIMWSYKREVDSVFKTINHRFMSGACDVEQQKHSQSNKTYKQPTNIIPWYVV